MAKVTIKKDPSGILPVEIHDFTGSPHDAIVHYSSLLPGDFDVFLNGELIKTPIPDEDFWGDDRLFDVMSDSDSLRIENLPKGFDPITAILIGVALNVTSTLLLSKPKTPGDQGQVKESPNNNLQAQTNIARSYQALPDIYGSPRPYPDLTGEANQEYVQRPSDVELSAQKVITQLMCVTVGTYFETDVLSGDSPLTEFQDSSYTMYRPVAGNTVVPFVRESFPISEVNSQELFGLNQVPEEYSFDETATAPNNTRIFPVSLNWGLRVNLTDYPTFNAPLDDYPRSGTLRVVGEEQTSGDPFSGQFDVTWTANNFVPGGRELLFTLISGSIPDIIIDITELELTVSETVYVGPFKLPVLSEEAWIDIVFDRGLKGTVDFNLQYSPDGLGGWLSLANFSYTADSLDQQFFTEKYTFAAPVDGFLRIRRTNDASEDANRPDLAKLERIAGIVTETNKSYGDVTLIEVSIPASRDVSNLRENMINLRGNRHVISYDRNTGQVDYTLRESRLGADHILHEWTEVYNQDPDLLNLEDLYDIYDNLDDPRLGFFDYTFDDLDVPLGERIQSIANCARVYAYQDGGIWQFRRDELQTQKATNLTRSDIATDNRTYSYNFSPALNATSKDSVQLEWVDPETNKRAYIRRQLVNGSFVDGAGNNPVIIEMPYCQEEYNAINRAELEIRKLVYLREYFTETFLQQGLFLELGDKFGYEEVYNQGVIGGSILSVDGLTAFVNEKIDFSLGTLNVEYTDQFGAVYGPFEISQGPTDKSFTLVTGNLNNVFIADQLSAQRSSQFYITTPTLMNQLQYIVDNKIPSSDGRTVQLQFTLADDRVYDFD